MSETPQRRPDPAARVGSVPRLLLGPLLRHVGETTATVWVQTDRPCTVEVLGCATPTFTVADHHYALVGVDGLAPGSSTPYEVHLDGVRVWPRAGSGWPPSLVRTRGGGTGTVRVVFGSCRHAKPDDPRAGRSLGADALDVYASRLRETPPEQWPQALLLLGDQVYADDTTPQMKRYIAARRDVSQPPWDEVKGFDEYAQLYLDSWSDEEVRWLLSTVPTAMIFDDHDVRDDWNTSRAWRDEVTATPWWSERIRGALASYWVYQHAGNLPPQERADDPWHRAVLGADGDAWPLLREMAGAADVDPSTVRWSYRWDVDGVRVVMVDSRAGRVLDEGARSMLDEAEFRWVEDAVADDASDADHVLVGTSLPWLLPPAIADAQSANEAAVGRGSRLHEKVRQAADLEHWSAFRASFDRLGELFRRVASAPDAPATVSVLSGDVHHSYAARVHYEGGPPVRSGVFQLVCSPVHHEVPAPVKALMRAAWSRPLGQLGRWLRRREGVGDPALTWERVSGPHFGNMLATVHLQGREAALTVERAVLRGRGARLERVADVALTGGGMPSGVAPGSPLTGGPGADGAVTDAAVDRTAVLDGAAGDARA